MPPYWALGFQISRWGLQDLDHVRRIVDRNLAAKVPLEAVYGYIDYMAHRQDFTIDQEKYGNLSAYVDELHEKNMRYVIILVRNICYICLHQLHCHFFMLNVGPSYPCRRSNEASRHGLSALHRRCHERCLHQMAGVYHGRRWWSAGGLDRRESGNVGQSVAWWTDGFPWFLQERNERMVDLLDQWFV